MTGFCVFLSQKCKLTVRTVYAVTFLLLYCMHAPSVDRVLQSLSVRLAYPRFVFMLFMLQFIPVLVEAW